MNVQLKPRKIKKKKYNLIFFDTESIVKQEITQDNINRVLAGDKVIKPHILYLLVAEWWGKSPLPSIYTGKDITEKFWTDVDKHTTKTKPSHVFAHNARYDVLVSKCIPELVSRGWKVTMFSEQNQFSFSLKRMNDR
jgi:hypothetical protein